MTTPTGTPVTFKDRALRVIAILGLIAILLLGAWGIIQIAFTLYGFLGNIGHTNTPSGTAKTEQVLVTAPSAIESGTPFTLSFTHQNASGNYAYDISYSCADGLEIEAPLPTGKAQSVPCNTPFNYTNATQNVQLTAKLSGNSPVDTTFSVAARNLATNKTTATGTDTASVSPAKAAAAPSKTPSSTYVPATRTSSLSGKSDLAVTMGSVSGSGGNYSVQFTIKNVGTNVTPSGWTFNASLPSTPAYTYTSNPQQALYPGDKIVYTLSFNLQNNSYTYNTPTYTSNPYPYGYPSTYPYPATCGYAQNYTYNGVYNYPTGYNLTCSSNTTSYSPYSYPNYSYPNYTGYTYPQTYTYGSGVVTVTVDPSNYVSESSEANNSASATLY